MSIFTIKDIDNVLLLFCDVIDDLVVVNRLNKYYNRSINDNILFQSWIKLYEYNKKNRTGLATKNDRLFINACRSNNLLYKYLIKKFTDIDIHAYNEYAFESSCENGHLHIAQWLIKFKTIP